MSREKKYTPGPWNAEKENIHIGHVATCHGDSGAGWYEVWTENWSDGVDQKANANLIAAAPDLLESLEGIMKDAGSDQVISTYWLSHANAAIAKAYGGHHE